MPEFEISDALKHYFEDARIRAAVDALLDDAAGGKMPESSWTEARDYNQALLMAVQTRTDFVDLKFRIWEEAFGKADPRRFGSDYFDWSYYKPSEIWRDGYLSRAYYRNEVGVGYTGEYSEELYVCSENGRVGLRIYRWQDDSTQITPSVLDGVEGWRIASDADYEWAENVAVPIAAFLGNPDPVIQRFREEAQRAVDVLVKAPG